MKKFYDKTWKKIVLGLLALVVIAAVFGGTTAEPEAKGAPVAKRSEECVKVNKTIQKRLLGRLQPVGPAWAVKSDDFKSVYMVASRFEMDGETYEGVWGVTDLRLNRGLYISVDGMAQEFTPWPDSANGEKFSIADDGAQEAVDCL